MVQTDVKAADDFHGTKRLYSPHVLQVKAWFEDAKRQLAEKPPHKLSGEKTLLYIGERNSSDHSGDSRSHGFYRQRLKETPEFGHLVAILDPALAFDEQWPNDRDIVNLFDLCIKPAIPDALNEFLPRPCSIRIPSESERTKTVIQRLIASF